MASQNGGLNGSCAGISRIALARVAYNLGVEDVLFAGLDGPNALRSALRSFPTEWFRPVSAIAGG